MGDGGGGQAPDEADDDAEEEPTEDAGAGSAPEPPGTGFYRVRQEASGLCMTLGPEPENEGRTVTVLGHCEDAYPDLQWEAEDAAEEANVYVVEMHFDDDTDCLGVDYGGDETGLLMAAYGCEWVDTQHFRLEPLGGGGFLIRPSSSEHLCMGMLPEQPAEQGRAIATAECDAGDAEQRWTLDG